MPCLYDLAVFGHPSQHQTDELQQLVGKAVGQFGLRLGKEVGWRMQPAHFEPDPQTPAAAVFFGADDTLDIDVQYLLDRDISVLPVVSNETRVQFEIPNALRHLNALAYDSGGAQRVTTALLESAGLLPRQRRIFISYRRAEAREVALQLFEALSARVFDVFLDTHDISPGVDFQAMLWHRLCDADVLVMLDTPSYFDSAWTTEELLRAQVKGLPTLRIGWPGVAASPAIGTATDLPLTDTDLDPNTARLTQDALLHVIQQSEAARSKGLAVRRLMLISRLKNSLIPIHGTFSGVGAKQAIHIRLMGGRQIVILPTVGVPSSRQLQEAASLSPDQPAVVLYDHVGLTDDSLQHIDWLDKQMGGNRYLKSREADWQLAGWGNKV